jgi:hypothetical protein
VEQLTISTCSMAINAEIRFAAAELQQVVVPVHVVREVVVDNRLRKRQHETLRSVFLLT